MKKFLIILFPLIFIFASCSGGADVESASTNNNTEQESEENSTSGTTGGGTTTQPQNTSETPEETTGGTSTDNPSTSSEEPENQQENTVVVQPSAGFHGFVYLGEYECRVEGTRHTLVLNPTSIVYDGVEYTYVQSRRYEFMGSFTNEYWYLLSKGSLRYYFSASRANDGVLVHTNLISTESTSLPSSRPNTNGANNTSRSFAPVTETSGSSTTISTAPAIDLSWSVDVEGYVISTDSATGRVLTVTSNGNSWVATTHSKVSENASNSTRRLTFANEALGRELVFRHVDNNVLFITETVNGTTTTYRINDYLNYQTDHWSAFDVLYPQIIW